MTTQTPLRRQLDPSDYNLTPDEIAFFEFQTDIHDSIKLREHIQNVQAEAYEVYPYTCIRRFMFATFTIPKHPAYDSVLKIGVEKPHAILLDLGCCFGTDVRKIISDGFPLESVVASDLRPEFWALGHKLFRSTQETFPVPFLPGDVFEPTFLSHAASPLPTSPTPSSPAPKLSTLTSLTQLQHHVSVIHISAVFHLFAEPSQQNTLAYLLGTLLSPLPGSIIFGSQAGLPDIEKNKDGGMKITGRGTEAYVHSPTSFTKMWVGEGGVFHATDVVLDLRVTGDKRRADQSPHNPHGAGGHSLTWSVTRV